MQENGVNLLGKTAIVTGASRGLGAHLARTLAAAGAHIILIARDRERLTSVADEITTAGGSAEIEAVDVNELGKSIAVPSGFADADIIVNCAGIVREKPALDQSTEDWDDVLNTNLKAMFKVAQIAGQNMKHRGAGGTIINIASILGIRPAANVLPYSVSKAGVIQMTKLLALEFARFNVRVNALAPGYIETDLNREFWASDAGKAMIRRIPTRRLGSPEDLDGPLLLLASDASRHMTGSVVVVDGGHLISSL